MYSFVTVYSRNERPPPFGVLNIKFSGLHSKQNSDAQFFMDFTYYVHCEKQVLSIRQRGLGYFLITNSRPPAY